MGTVSLVVVVFGEYIINYSFLSFFLHVWLLAVAEFAVVVERPPLGI